MANINIREHGGNGREHEELRETRTSARGERRVRVFAGISSTEALFGAGAVALAILGLAGVVPVWFAAIATIAVGVALVIEGGGIAARFRSMLSALGGRRDEVELGGGMTVELLGGLGGIALGIIALAGVAPLLLVGVAALVYGGTFLLGAGTMAGVETVIEEGEHEGVHTVARQAVRSAGGARALVGAGAVVLGILALLQVGAAGTPLALLLITMLSLGGALLLSGSAMGGRVASALHH